MERTRRHALLDIIVIANGAVISNADHWWTWKPGSNAKLDWLRQYLPLPNGIPSHDSFGDVFGRLAPEQFESSSVPWVQAVMGASSRQEVALDCKLLRCPHDRRLGKSAIHLISANHLQLIQSRYNRLTRPNRNRHVQCFASRSQPLAGRADNIRSGLPVDSTHVRRGQRGRCGPEPRPWTDCLACGALGAVRGNHC